MSEHRFECPSCGQHIVCDTDAAGQVTRCPSCETEMRIPAPPGPGATGLPKGRPLQQPAPPASKRSNGEHRQSPPASSSAHPHETVSLLDAGHSRVWCPVCNAELDLSSSDTALPSDIDVEAKLSTETKAPSAASQEPGTGPEPRKPNLAYIKSGGKVLKEDE